MRMPNPETLREVYPVGTRVVLVQMDDPQAPPAGTCGTVEGVDDACSILVHWDNGSGLNVVYGEDVVKKLEYQGTESAAEGYAKFMREL